MSTQMFLGALAAFATLILFDMPWVLLNTRYGIYKGHINGLIKIKGSVAFIWVLILIVNCFLVAYIASTASSWWSATLACAYVGLAIYLTFNGTALVAFSTWPLKVALVDTAWGVVLYGAAGLASYLAAQSIN